MKTEAQEKFIKILNEIFEMDKSDLDFGIYRVMNLKRKEITEYLKTGFPNEVKGVLQKYNENSSGKIRSELEKAIKQAEALGADPSSMPRVQELKTRLSETRDFTELENGVYNHLAVFFRRYYDKGDFISRRRYKGDIYAIPYGGEEVKLHWANADQYYIKSGEHFKDFQFKLEDGRKVHFKIVEVEGEQKDNNKPDAKRNFILREENPILVEDEELVFSFEYRELSKAEQKINTVEVFESSEFSASWKALLDIVNPKEQKAKQKTVLERQLYHYTSRNNYDYFIHKNIEKFLKQELDFYIKNEVMLLDDLDDAKEASLKQQLDQIRAIKSVGHKIIQFIAQFEEFQKKLWLKKKFIVDAGYCMTLDYVPAELLEAVESNEAQWNEWLDLGFFTEEPADRNKWMAVNPFAVIDTKFYDPEFKQKLLASIDDIDEKTDGVILNSENFQALNLLQEKYREKVKCVYIDPPYNTEKDRIKGKFIYKDGFSDSSWLSFLNDRISKSYSLLDLKRGVLFESLDENEYANQLLQNTIMDHIGTIVLQTATDNNPRQIVTEHEYILCFSKKGAELEQWTGHSEAASLIQDYYLDLKRKYGDNLDVIQTELRKWIKKNKRNLPKVIHYDNVDKYGVFHDADVANTKFGGYEYNVIHPKTKKICKIPAKGFRFPEKTMKEMILAGDIMFGTDETTLIKPKKRLEKVKDVLRSIIYEDGRSSTKILENLFFRGVFDNPKSINIIKRIIGFTLENDDFILDYFAGSGTTGHAVINLNRDDKDNGNRKYILVEMGKYFDSVLKKRLQKVVYSPDWKDGKAQNNNGSSHILKYFKMESYEDVLNNLQLAAGELFDGSEDEGYKDSYYLNYMMETESRDSLLNMEKFDNPFDYRLKIATDVVGETEEKQADLVETFNYMIGLNVSAYRFHQVGDGRVQIVEGINREDEKVLVIWRDSAVSNEQLNAFVEKQQINIHDKEYDLIYVNRDNNLENVRNENDHWKVRLIDTEFHKLMFEV